MIESQDPPDYEMWPTPADVVSVKEAADKVLDAISKGYDPVNHPDHYTSGGMQCWDAIKASMSDEAFKGYLKGNILKYMWRYEVKNGVEDLQKAQFYINRLIKEVSDE